LGRYIVSLFTGTLYKSQYFVYLTGVYIII